MRVFVIVVLLMAVSCTNTQTTQDRSALLLRDIYKLEVFTVVASYQRDDDIIIKMKELDQYDSRVLLEKIRVKKKREDDNFVIPESGGYLLDLYSKNGKFLKRINYYGFACGVTDEKALGKVHELTSETVAHQMTAKSEAYLNAFFLHEAVPCAKGFKIPVSK